MWKWCQSDEKIRLTFPSRFDHFLVVWTSSWSVLLGIPQEVFPVWISSRAKGNPPRSGRYFHEITVACTRANRARNNRANSSVTIHTVNLFDFRAWLNERFLSLLSDNWSLYCVHTELNEWNGRNCNVPTVSNKDSAFETYHRAQSNYGQLRPLRPTR